MRLTAALPGFIIATALILSACTGAEGVNGVPEPRPSSSSTIESGRRLIAQYGCGSCHTIPGVPGADALAAPPLNNFYERTYIAGRLPNNETNLMLWIEDPQKVWPGNAMPNLGITASQARDIASYLYHQPTLGDVLNP